MTADQLRTHLIHRIVGFHVAAEVLDGLAGMLMSAGRALERIGEGVFLGEVDAARRYRDLTGYDPACVLGKPDYYNEKDEDWCRIEEDDDD